jgi:hypothetical protein
MTLLAVDSGRETGVRGTDSGFEPKTLNGPVRLLVWVRFVKLCEEDRYVSGRMVLLEYWGRVRATTKLREMTGMVLLGLWETGCTGAGATGKAVLLGFGGKG